MSALTRAFQRAKAQQLIQGAGCSYWEQGASVQCSLALPAVRGELRWSNVNLSGIFNCKRRRHLVTTCSAGQANGVEPPDVLDLAIRARLEVTPEEVKDWTPKIEKIVDWFGQLQEIDVEEVPPALRAGGIRQENTVQEDEPRVFENRSALWDAVPSKEGPFIRVPKILNESTE